MNESGFRLYATPSFMEGVARLVDVTGTIDEYNYSASPEQADYRALRSDWEAIGRDIWNAISQFAKEQRLVPND